MIMEKGTRSFRDYEDTYEPFFLLGAEGRGFICWGRRVARGLICGTLR